MRRTRDADTLKWLEDRGPWRCQAEDSLPTLQQLFEELPKGAGFDLEVKMTTLEGGGSTPPEEVSRVLNPILETARRFCSDRLVVFSSFDPDICIDLRRRDTGAAVLFLTCCGQEHPDERVRSVEAAIALASAHKLDGIVVDAERLHDREELMKTVRDSGLYLATYGRRNNQRGWVEKQFAQGVNAIIADDMGGALGSLSLS